MPLKDILVHLDDSVRCLARLEVAAGLAAQHGAHLTGLFVVDLPPAETFYGFPSDYVDPNRAGDFIKRVRERVGAAAGRLQAAFGERCRRDGIEAEWRLIEGVTAEVVPLHGRYADMLVLGQPDRSDPATGWRTADLPTTTLIGCGRPVLMVPFAGDFASVGQNVLIGWNASAEAARAVNDALPILAGARKVTVLSINQRRGIGGVGDVPAADIALHLARHGIKAEAAHRVATDISEGDALLSYAADIGADLLVIGLYGHSRMHEMVFGGVTRSLLAEMTVPVLMAH
jgi:nucleotide-binding universal stress UspA family protein